MNARWPVAGPVDELLLKSSDYLMDACHDFRIRYKQFLIPPKAGKGTVFFNVLESICPLS